MAAVTNAFRWLVPHPLMTILLAFVWILLQNDFSAGMAVFGLILGILLPWATSIWWPGSPNILSLRKVGGYSLLVVYDIMVANIEVAWIVLTVPNHKLKPAWIVVPLDLKQPEAITVLAGTITLTPGTVSADLSSEGNCLLVHVLHTDDPDGVRDEIKQRYEARLEKIFA